MTYLIDTLFYATVFFKFDFLTRMVLNQGSAKRLINQVKTG